jgi:subtilase family serine protease
MRFTRPKRLIPAFLATALVGVLAPTVSASAAVPVCADLQVVSFTVNPATPIQGQQATIDVKVTNAGTCTAFGATVQWKITPFATSGPSDQITSLGAGQTTDVLLPYTFTKAGNFESIAIVDTKNTVPETNEKNNTQILPVTVLAAGIDLSISSISTQPDPPVADGYPNDPVQGRNETTTIVVHNGGNTAAGPFQVKWVPKPFAPAVTKAVASLGANSSVSINLSYTYQQAGTFRSTATVDATRRVKETNERNNTATKSVVVRPQAADLIVTDVAISPTPIIPGGLTTATITVKNQGNTPAGAFMVNWRPQPFVSPVSQQVGSLGVNDSTSVVLQYTFARAGSFAGLVTADSTKVVKEINENNNTLATHVVVAPNTVDLQIVSETITGVQEEQPHLAAQGGTVIGTPTQGVPVHVDIEVQNTGNTHSGAFLVDWNPDATYVSSPSLQTVTKEVVDLGAGETTHVTFDFTYDVYGNFSTLATLDPRNQVTETNEANNQNIVPITVVPAPIDLTISLDVSPEPIVRGTDGTATITVTNNGDFPASKPFTVQWFPTGSGFPKSQVIQGLSPNESTTVTFTNTYSVVPQGGTYDSYAVVDSGNTIPETDEGNNTVHKTVTVVHQQTSFTVKVSNFHANSDGDTGLAGDGEWDPMIFAVYNPDPAASCTLFGQTIQHISCVTNKNTDVEDGENFNPGLAINLTLTEQTPLLAATAVLEDDSPGIPPIQFLGYAYVISPNPAYKTLDKTVDAQSGDCEHGPACFNATFQVSNVTSNVPANMNLLSVDPTDEQLAAMNEFETVVQQHGS